MDAAIHQIRKVAAVDLRVGPNCLSSYLPRDSPVWLSAYYSDSPATATIVYMPDVADCRKPVVFPVALAIEGTPANDPTATPRLFPIGPVPRVGGKKQCPCGSGKQYRHCHGRLR
jgi:SEC-C motif-containing protein